MGRLSYEKNLAKQIKVCYTYDVLSRVIQRKAIKLSDNSEVIETYSYNSAGNLCTACGNESFRYDANNRLTEFSGKPVTYDADGNMLEASIGKFTYDSANRLTVAGTRYYTYDVEGTRIKTQKGEDTTEFVYNVNARLSQLLIKTENNAVTKYVYGLGLIGEETSGNFKTYHFDYRGSTVAITNANGTVTDTFEYDTYGKLKDRTGTTKTPFLYNGRDGVITEDDTGLIYMRARYYSLELRRFVNADKVHGDISNALSLNRYAFVNGNPASFVDPLGLSADNARGQINYNGEWYDIYVPSPGMHFDAQWESVKTVTVNDVDFNWAAFFAGIEFDDYSGYLTGENVNRKYVGKKEIYKMGAYSAFGSILSGLDNLESVYLDFVFEKYNDSKRVKIFVGSSERTKHYNALADGYEHGVQLLYHYNPIYQGELSDAIGQLYTASPNREAKKWYQLYDMNITIDKRHAGERHFSYLSVDENGTLIETPIIYKNDKVEIGKTVFGYGLSDPIRMPISAPSRLPDEFFELFDKMEGKEIYGIR